MATCKLILDPARVAKAEDPDFAVTFARIECHYFVNAGFFEEDGQLLKNASRIAHIPTTIVQGRYDMVCPATTAWELHKELPSATFHLVQDAGHSASEPGIIDKLLEATDEYASL
eukprot:TRINITY_DN1426_c1_g1_i2.p2 TRINITY_DN1426_c1_g1~~TRINITY_DN1426_c1_g1_i2.p2  ORF type:complete len:115 (-),score=47.28 TRINITY_DN1426_c1_g1_i2:371-715(-)